MRGGSFLRKQWSLITYGVSGRRRKSRPTRIVGGLGNHPKVETTQDMMLKCMPHTENKSGSHHQHH
jgi:hypothetical protein